MCESKEEKKTSAEQQTKVCMSVSVVNVEVLDVNCMKESTMLCKNGVKRVVGEREWWKAVKL